MLRDQPDATLDELAQALGCARMTVWRALRRLKITRKKKVFRADERNNPKVQKKRRQFKKEVASLNAKHLVFVDETGATTALDRLYGWARAGQRVFGSVPGSWKTQTLISGVRLRGVVAPFTFPGATDNVAFQTYVEKVLAPQLRRGDVVIWDNLKPHQQQVVVQAVARRGARVLPLPPWSPDLTPIEKMYSKVKGFLRTLAARSPETLVEALGASLRRVWTKDILGWFRSCGLALERKGKRRRGLLHRLRPRNRAPPAWEAL